MMPFSFGYIQPRLEQISLQTVLHYIRPTDDLIARFDSYFFSNEFEKIESEYIEFLNGHGKFEYSI